MIKVSLLFVPTQTNEASAEAPAVDNQGGVFPPLQLAYIAAILEQYNHEVDIIDINALNLSKEETKLRIKKFKADIIGFSTGVIMWRETLRWARYMKKHLNIKTVVGNIIMSQYPREVLSHKEIDYGIIGHDYYTLLGLMDVLKGVKNASQIEGLAYKENGKVKINPFIKRKKYSYKDLNKLLLPARHLLPNEKYYEFYTKKKNFTLMLTSTGCSCNCKFCANKFDPLIFRPIKDVVDEMEECYYNHNIKEIDFKDNTFTLNRKRTVKLCNEIKNRNVAKKIRWSCMTRADLVDEPLLIEMKKAGCIHIKYGIESGSQKILNRLCKGITLDEIRTAVYLTKKHGMETYGFFMIGVPGETRETAMETIKFAQTLGFDTSRPVLTEIEEYPDGKGSYPELKKELGYDMWRKYILDENYKLPKRNIYTNLTEEEVNEFMIKAYRGFYFRPKYVINSLLHHRNITIIKKGAMAGLSILTNGLSVKALNYFRSINNSIKSLIKVR